MPVYHSLTATTPDDPRYEIRPSHWNEEHSLALSGSEVIGAFSNAGNVSFAVETNGRITASANVTAAASPVNVTAGTTSGNLQTIAFSNSNGVSFGLNGSTITASHNGLTTAAQSNQVVNSLNGSTGQISLNVGSSLSASTNGSSITFGLASNITTALQPAGAYLTTARASNDAIGLNTAGSNVTWTANSSGLSLDARGYAGTAFSGTNISGTVDSAGIRLSVGAGGAADGGVGLSAGANSISTGTVVFSNSNGVSFGLNGSTVTASHNGLTTAAASNHSHGNPTLNLTNLSGTTASNSAGFTLSLSAAAPGGAASQTLYATGNTTVNSSGTMALSSLLMRGYGIVSLGTSNGSILVSSPDPTTLAPNWYAVGNTTGASSSTTLAADTISIQGTGGVSVGYSNGSLVISGNTGAGGGYSAGVSTGGNTAGATGLTGSNLVFVGSGPISLSQTTGANGGTISINAPATSSLSATGILSISTNGSTISIGAGPVTMYAASNTTQASSNSVHLSALTFQGAGVASVGVSNGSVVISVPSGGGAGDGYNILAAGTQTATTAGSVLFENSNGITFGMSGSTRITASHNGLTSQSNQALSAANGSFAFQTANFSNANGVSFITSAGSAIAASVETSYAASNHSHGNPTLALTNLSGTTASNSAGLTLSLSAAAPGGGVSPVVSANNGSYSFTTLSFSNANGVSFGTSAGSAVTASYTVPSVTQYFSNTGTTFNGANISGSMTLNTNGLQLSMSVAAPGAAAENNAINLLGANTAGNTTATGSTIGWSGVNVTLSGTNASQVVISAPATSSLVGVSGVSVSTNGSTISVYDNVTLSGYLEGILDRELLAAQIGNAQLFVQPLRLRNHVQFDEICELVNFSNASNSSNSATLSLLVGFYTRNNSTLSLVTSASRSYAITASGTVGSYSIYGGPREYPIGFTTTLTKGDYYIGFLSRTTTGGGAGMTWSNFVGSNINSAYSGRFSSANNATNQFVLGQGSYATTTTAIPGSIAFSQINGSAAANLRPVIYKLASGDLN